MTLKITLAKKKDFPELAKIIKEEFSKPPYNDKWTLKNAVKTLENYKKKNRKIYKATMDKITVGLLIIREDYSAELPSIWIEELVVKEKFQKQGIGKGLIEKLESDSKKNKVKYIAFSTHKDASAVNFYKKLGYEEREKVIFMRKELK